MTAASHRPPSGALVVRRRLDALRRRIRLLRVLAGVGHLLSLALAGLALLYLLDRLLVLPLGARGVVGALLLVVLARQAWRRIGRPLFAGPDALDAARLTEQVLDVQGLLVSALQIPPGPPGSLEHRLGQQAEEFAARTDLRAVLSAGPSLRQLAQGAGSLLGALLLVVVVHPQLDVFAQRWSLHDVSWPRDTHLLLEIPPRSPVHVLQDDGSLLASRGGAVSLSVEARGLRPDRVDLVVENDQEGRRSLALSLGSGGRFLGHISPQRGDRALFVRGGDDPGDDNRIVLRVIEPPRLDDPVFRLQPPSYTGRASEEVHSAGLVVTEGTLVTVAGQPTGEALSATLWMLGSGESLALEVTGDAGHQQLAGSFVATHSDTLSIVLTGEHGLATPDPGQHALLVHEDHPPALRVYAPARSDVKLTARAVVPFGVLAEDDHGVDGVSLALAQGGLIQLTADDAGGGYRHVLDLDGLQLSGSVGYELRASDRRDLPGKGPQTATTAGRRLDIVEPAEVQRLLADRQLRLKEAFGGIQERQQLARQAVEDLLAEPPSADDPDLVAAAVSQNQVSSRLLRETQQLCAILDETILDRLDPGPGAEAVLQRRLDDWRTAPVDQGFDSGAHVRLAADYAAGRFGRLDAVGRLLDMSGLALQLTLELSPAAHDLLQSARNQPGSQVLSQAYDKQTEVLTGLSRLLDRMDEWEDFQEVLNLVKSMIDDQQSLRQASRKALTGGSGGN